MSKRHKSVAVVTTVEGILGVVDEIRGRAGRLGRRRTCLP
jgi:hypothetical protein